MGNRKFAIQALEEKGQTVMRCNGNSMRPMIAPNEAIHLRKVSPRQLRVGDAVFCRINGNLQVHKITAIRNNNEEFQISNNHGHVNGWIGAKGIFGLAFQVDDRVLVSDRELEERLLEQLESERKSDKTELSEAIKKYDTAKQTKD